MYVCIACMYIYLWQWKYLESPSHRVQHWGAYGIRLQRQVFWHTYIHTYIHTKSTLIHVYKLYVCTYIQVPIGRAPGRIHLFMDRFCRQSQYITILIRIYIWLYAYVHTYIHTCTSRNLLIKKHMSVYTYIRSYILYHTAHIHIIEIFIHVHTYIY